MSVFGIESTTDNEIVYFMYTIVCEMLKNIIIKIIAVCYLLHCGKHIHYFIKLVKLLCIYMEINYVI